MVSGSALEHIRDIRANISIVEIWDKFEETRSKICEDKYYRSIWRGDAALNCFSNGGTSSDFVFLKLKIKLHTRLDAEKEKARKLGKK